MIKRKYFLFLCLLLTVSCTTEFKALQPGDLDNSNILPKSGPDLLSLKGTPSEADKEKFVIVFSHGFTATPYENKFILDNLTARDAGFLTSSVMLGGHGTDVYDFEASTWQDWQKPLESELDKLNELGYKNVGIITTSTSGTLLMELLSRKNYPNLKKTVMIAPLVSLSNKAIQFVDVLSPFIRSMPTKLEDESVGNWYRERPVKALSQLNRLTSKVRHSLEKGINLPEGVDVLIIQSLHENTVDPLSSAIIRYGLKGEVEVKFVDSKRHIPIVPDSQFTEADRKIEKNIYDMTFDFFKS